MCNVGWKFLDAIIDPLTQEMLFHLKIYNLKIGIVGIVSDLSSFVLPILSILPILPIIPTNPSNSTNQFYQPWQSYQYYPPANLRSGLKLDLIICKMSKSNPFQW